MRVREKSKGWSPRALCATCRGGGRPVVDSLYKAAVLKFNHELHDIVLIKRIQREGYAHGDKPAKILLPVRNLSL